MNKTLVIAFFLLLGFSSMAQTSAFDPRQIQVSWELIGNNYQDKPQFAAALNFTNKSSLLWPATGWKIYFSLRYHGYTLASLSPELNLKHVSGDLFCITPATPAVALAPGKTMTMRFTGNGRIANYQDVPSGLFIVDEASSSKTSLLQPEVKKNAALVALSDGAAKIYGDNKKIASISETDVIKVLPTPDHYLELKGYFELDPRTAIILADKMFRSEAGYLAAEIGKVLGQQPEITERTVKGKSITLKKATLANESYTLTVTTKEVVIAAGDGAGIFYGIQSLKSLMDPLAWSSVHNSVDIKAVKITDAPRFPFRAFMLDVGRNFQSKEQVLKILEIMSLYKLNVFHFHLNDDEGWRIEIPGIPELTETGSKRGYPFDALQQLHPSYGSGPDGNRTQGSGYYSKRDFVEILRFATLRHIRVIPEIESPGHARAAVKAMDARYAKYYKIGKVEEANRYLLHEAADSSAYLSNQGFRDNVMNAALPSTYRFVEKVVDEIKFMYAEAGAPLSLIHMAGDEVPDGTWQNSPAVRELTQNDASIKNTKDLWNSYFSKLNAMLKSKGLSLYGWEELVLGTQTTDEPRHVTVNAEFIKDKIQVDAWWSIFGNENVPYQLANTGYKTVISFFDYLYFDLAYQPGFDEPGDGWVGYLDIEKTWSLIPYDYYRNDKTDLTGKPYPPGIFDKKEILTVEGRKNIVGIQSALWGENLNDPALVEYQLLPKLLSMAERAWTKDPEWVQEKDSTRAATIYLKDWSAFVNTLSKRELPRMDYYNGGYLYRIPSPGGIVTNGAVVANVQLPDYKIFYTIDGSEPTMKSLPYIKPIKTHGQLKFKTFNRLGRGSKTITVNY